MDLPLRFFLEGEHYVLVESKDATYLEDDHDEVGPWEAQRVLDDARSRLDPHALHRADLRGAPSRGVRARLDDDPGRLVLLRRRRPIYAMELGQPLLDDLADLVPTLEPAEDTWIEVLVVDDDDVPVAGVEYEIELSDGRKRRGRTSEHGILRYEGMPPGACKLSLLSVEASGWERA